MGASHTPSAPHTWFVGQSPFELHVAAEHAPVLSLQIWP
jgi:hypothetical protein